MKRRIAIAVLYIASVVFSFGAINAQFLADHDDRLGSSLAMAAALIPVCNIVGAVFLTGFCEHGFSYRMGKRDAP